MRARANTVDLRARLRTGRGPSTSADQAPDSKSTVLGLGPSQPATMTEPTDDMHAWFRGEGTIECELPDGSNARRVSRSAVRPRATANPMHGGGRPSTGACTRSPGLELHPLRMKRVRHDRTQQTQVDGSGTVPWL